MTPKIRKILEGKKYQIYHIFELELKEDPKKHINFSDVARRVGCSRKLVSYHYHKFKKMGLVGVDQNMMFLPAQKRNDPNPGRRPKKTS